MNFLASTAVTATTLLLWAPSTWMVVAAVTLLTAQVCRPSRQTPRRLSPTYPTTHGGCRPN